MTTDEERFEEEVLKNIEQPYHCGVLSTATHFFQVDNPTCGDSVQIFLQIDQNSNVSEAWFVGRGCLISQAAASILMRRAEAMTVSSILEFTARQMLDLFGLPLTPRRQRCCLLSWQALRAAVQHPIRSTP